MYKLVVHHTYKLGGEAFDLSDYGNHGRRVATTAVPGRVPGKSALYFAGGPDRVVVRSNNSLNRLRSIQAEAWIYVEDLSKRSNIMEGELSFAFFIHPDGVLWGTFYDPDNLTGSDWPGVNTDAAFAPDGVKHTVPLNTWVHVKYVHDGVASARLYINDVLVGANYNVKSSVRSVSSGGLVIGHWPVPGDDRYSFKGKIDEIKLWKYDDDVIPKEFFCRPMNPEQFKCWKRFFDQIGSKIGSNEGKAWIWFMKCIKSAQDEWIRAIRSKGEKAMDEQNRFAKRHQELWCSGDIAGDEMKKLLDEYASWLEANVSRESFIAWKTRIDNCIRELKFEGRFKDMSIPFDKCDPKYVAYFKLLFDRWGYLFGIAEKPKRSFIEILMQWIRELILRLFRSRSEIKVKGGGL